MVSHHPSRRFIRIALAVIFLASSAALMPARAAAAAEAGADIVDVAIDAMSGLTSQPSLGAMVANLAGSRLDTGLDPSMVGPLNSYWETVIHCQILMITNDDL
jgi:pyruvate carboxylase